MKPIYTLLILLIPFVGLGQELTYVPDDNFEQTLIDWGLDDVLDDYVVTDSINTFTWYPNTSISEGLNLSNKNISDLTGIEDFTSIYGLNISDNNLTYVDLSQNTLLETLKCSNNHLQTIDLSQNILLEYIRCENNQLTSINLENIQGLRYLNLSYNKLKELDLSETSLYINPSLSIVQFTLNLNYNFFLDSLNLKYFDVSDFTNLNLSNTSLKCVLVDDSSDLPPVLFTDNSPYLQFTEENCDYVNTSGQYTGYSIDTLSINNVEAVFGQRSFCWDLIGAHFEVPKESNKHSVFAHEYWIGGIAESGSLHLAAQTYRQTGSDFFPGPVSDSIHQNNGTMSKWDRQWKLTKSEIDNHITNYSDPNYQVPEAIISWPAHGDIALGQNYNLAPYIDVNDNNIYDPYNGDYPCIKGDEAIYMIRNDVGNSHSESGHYSIRRKYSTSLLPYIDTLLNEQYFLGIDTDIINNDTVTHYLYDFPTFYGNYTNFTTEQFFIGFDTIYFENKIGLEQHLMFYAFNDSSNEALHHSIFVENTLYNRQNKNFDSLMIGLWSDTDLGHYLDDWIGCNVELNMGYSFNGDIEDEGANGYGLTPPAIGVKLLDSEMSAFVYYNNDFSVQGNPQNRQQYHNYLLAKWKDGLDITYGGDGRGGTIPSKFFYPGNSDPNGIGTNGIITSDDWDDSDGWTEDNSGNAPADRRFLQSTGPFEFFAGDKLTINYAFVWSRASEGDNLASVDKLFTDAQSIQEFFDLNYYTCPENEDIGQLGTFNCEVDGCQDPQNGTGLYSSIEECLEECNSSIKENSFMVLIYPNPSSNTFNTEYYSEKVSEVIVTNILGEQVYFESIKSIGDISTKIDLSDYSKGVYNLTIKTPDDISNHKLILQ